MKTMRVLLFLVMITLVGCGASPQRSGGDILVIGDSVMAWNRASGRDIGRVISAELGRDVTSRAVVGAGIRSGGLGPLARPIPSQLSTGQWKWVVMNGGANDLGSTCGCARCAPVIDSLISRDGRTGDIPQLITTARAQGAQVLWMGYYQSPGALFRGCRPALVELDRRIALYASATDGVFFADAEDVIAPNNPGLFAPDQTHPSVAGSALIGKFLARVIAANSPRSAG